MIVEHERRYQRASDRSVGFVFPCTEEGKVRVRGRMTERYQQCLTDPDIRDLGVYSIERTITIPGMLECPCGAENLFTRNHTVIHCHACGRRYDMGGRELKR